MSDEDLEKGSVERLVKYAGQVSRLVLSRRQSNEVSSRAAYLDRSPHNYLEEVVREGLKTLPRPEHYDEAADIDERFGLSSQQRKPAPKPKPVAAPRTAPRAKRDHFRVQAIALNRSDTPLTITLTGYAAEEHHRLARSYGAGPRPVHRSSRSPACCAVCRSSATSWP